MLSACAWTMAALNPGGKTPPTLTLIPTPTPTLIPTPTLTVTPTLRSYFKGFSPLNSPYRPSVSLS